MTIEKLREFYAVEPFRPFIFRMPDGRKISVLSRAFILAAPSGRTVVVFQPDDTMNIIDLLLVSDLEVVPVQKSGNGKRKQSR